MPQAEAHRHFTGPYLLDGAGAGLLQMGTGIGVNAREHLSGTVLAVGIHQSLYHQPGGGGALDIHHGNVAAVDILRQIRNGGRLRQVLLGQNIRIHQQRALVCQEGGIEGRIGIVGVHREGQIQEHAALGLGTF